MLEGLSGSMKIISGLGVVGLIGVITVIVTKILGKKNVEQRIAHAVRQDDLQEDIEEVSKKQKIIIDQIKTSELAAEGSKQKVNDIVKKASQEISQVLDQDSLVKVDQKIKDEWSDL